MPSRALPWPALAALTVGILVVGALATLAPALALGLLVAAAAGAVLVRVRLSRLGTAAVIGAAVAGILGPNLALPQAPSLFAFRLLIVLLGLGLVAYTLMDGRLVVPRGLPRPAGLLIAMVAWSLLSIWWADDRVAAARWTLFLAMMGGLAVAIPLACRSRTAARRLLVVLGTTFLLATLIAFAELRLGIRLPTSALLGRDQAAATSLFGNQNNFATYLTLTLPYFLCMPVVFTDARLKALGIAGSVMTLAALLLTGSRSNLIAAALVVTGLVATLAFDRKRPAQFGAALVVAGLAAVLVIPSLFGNGILPIPGDLAEKFDISQFLAQRESLTGSGAVRQAVLTEGLGLVRDSQGVGIGAGNAESRVIALDSFTGVQNLHNWWLEVLVDLGVVGLALFVGLYLTLLRQQLRIARRTHDPFVRWLGLSGGLALVGFVVGSLGPSSVIHFAPMWITFGLGMLTLVMARNERA